MTTTDRLRAIVLGLLLLGAVVTLSLLPGEEGTSSEDRAKEAEAAAADARRAACRSWRLAYDASGAAPRVRFVRDEASAALTTFGRGAALDYFQQGLDTAGIITDLRLGASATAQAAAVPALPSDTFEEMEELTSALSRLWSALEQLPRSGDLQAVDSAAIDAGIGERRVADVCSDALS